MARLAILLVLVGCSSEVEKQELCEAATVVGNSVVCVDVLAKAKLRECEYDDGSRITLSNARIELRALDRQTGVELARSMHELRHDTSNLVTHGCPMHRDPSIVEKLPSYHHEVALLLGSVFHVEQVSTTAL